ncbi:NlpC/P60 family protein [Nonomuraea sp. B5E05]|uniref:NlpC/P60 family protein n=1 Tax=Nonomuraea sp. B5E05 TaxID=3153569 RepID=UPI00326109CC
MLRRIALIWLALGGGLCTTLVAVPDPALAQLKRTQTRGETAAAAALSQLGVSFSWGGGSVKGPTIGIGRGAATTGFDCSGLTLYAWSRAGVRLSHYTGAQFRQGRRIPLSARRRGDLLFFGGGTGDPTHVALFLGGGVMIHAPKTGDVVRKVDFLRSPYFRSAFRGAVRPG